MKTNFLLSVTALGVLAACTPSLSQHGNILKDEQIAEVKPGEHLRSDVLQILGSPTTQAPFDDNLWYYVGRQKERRGVLNPEVIDERVVAVRFDETGTVAFIHDLDTETLNVPISEDQTPAFGNESTVLQEFFGNLGKFNPQTAQ